MLTVLNTEASYFAIISKIIGPSRKQESILSVLMKSSKYLHNRFTLTMWALETFILI